MNFISNGDFGFPFEAAFYWIKHFFVWSFQNGAPNLDGILRVPTILMNALVFQLLGNVAASYFYIAIVVLLCFFSFYYFSRNFLTGISKTNAIIASVFFAINPIFLGNLAKIGLTFAAAMLPIYLVLLKKAFEKRQFRYIILYLLLLCISLIHPFTFAVNVAISGGYFAVLLWQHRGQRMFSWKQFIFIPILGVLFHAYFLLPIASIGSVSKDVLSQDLSGEATDFTDLVDVANTNGITNGLIFARDVLKDFDFYNDATYPIYVVGIFALYIAVFGAYIFLRKQWNAPSKKQFYIFVGVFLLLLLMATGTFLGIDKVIKFIIGLPGGWMFRSPLKWQLYIPFFFFGAFVLALKAFGSRYSRKIIIAASCILFLMVNTFMLTQVYSKMLVPRTIDNFASLQSENLESKSILFVNSNKCNDFARLNPEVLTELRQVVKSKNVQFKTVSYDLIKNIDINEFDYLIGCKDDIAKLPSANNKEFLSVKDRLGVYKNTAVKPYIYASDKLYELEKSRNVTDKHTFVKQNIGGEFNYSMIKDIPGSVALTSIFEDLKPSDFKDKAIVRNSGTVRDGKLYLDGVQSVFYKQDKDSFTFSGQSLRDYKKTETGSTQRLNISNQTNFAYNDSNFNYENLIKDPSFENGPWKNDVGDCSASDVKADLKMMLHKQNVTDGKQSLQLEARSHIACTGQNFIPVKPGSRYMISFDYQNPFGSAAGYNVAFNGAATSIASRLKSKNNTWQTVTEHFVIPQNVESINLTIYAYPDTTTSDASIARYDNFYLTEIPDLQHNFVAIKDQTVELKKPDIVNINVVNPVLKEVSIVGATKPFYLFMKDGYNENWNIVSENGKKISTLKPKHFAANNSMNGWYFDPVEICQSNKDLCTTDDQGKYNFNFKIKYGPQNAFYAGIIISIISWISVAAWLAYDFRKHKS